MYEFMAALDAEYADSGEAGMYANEDEVLVKVIGAWPIVYWHF